MRIKCINKSNFTNITLNQEYEVISSGKDMLKITNDIGIEADYHKKYFEEVKPKPKTLIPRFEMTSRSGQYVLTMIYGLETAPTRQETILTLYVVSSSCGVISFYGINNLTAVLKRLNLFNEDNFKNAITTVLEYVENSIPKAITLFSTNKAHREIWPIMDEISNFSSETRINPNSSNEIKVWGFYTSSMEIEVDNDEDEDEDDD